MLIGFKTGRIVLLAALLLLSAVSAKAQIYPAPPASLNTNAVTDENNAADGHTRLVTNGAGVWIAMWGLNVTTSSGPITSTVYSILFSRSLDNGSSWSAPTVLSADVSSFYDLQPHLAADGAGNWVAVWQAALESNGDDVTYFTYSSDNGLNWSTPALLNYVYTVYEYNVGPELATDGAGNWIVAWITGDNINGTHGIDADIAFARSTDNGQSWSATSLLNTNALTDVGGDSGVHLAADDSGNWIAAWESSSDISGNGSDGDLLFARSSNGGQTWSAPALLNTDNTGDIGMEQNVQLTTDNAGNWVAVWWSTERTLPGTGFDFDVYSARSTDNGVSWTAPVLLNTNDATDIGPDDSAQVTTDRMGNWIAVWRSESDITYDIAYARSTDNGASWTAQMPLTTEAISYGVFPQLTTDGAGNWIAVWESNAGNIPLSSFDMDIRYTTFTLLQHAADGNGDGVISLSELLRLIQFFNLAALHCDPLGEDGFNPGAGDQTCTPHPSDYNPQNWAISLNELLRLIQFFNLFGYYYCPGVGEDDFCPGTP